ncbi:hypothetical protein MPSEU_000540800 [Mayamaea pseudoterrestris]|nr:hypothetical protein MPSEU_000540800 [Mayamaea pseudoterrestris]
MNSKTNISVDKIDPNIDGHGLKSTEDDARDEEAGDDWDATDDSEERQRFLRPTSDDEEYAADADAAKAFHARIVAKIFHQRPRWNFFGCLLSIMLAVGVAAIYIIGHTKLNSHHPQVSETPLTSLITDDFMNVTSDVQYLMDFAIIGHAKTATTFIKHWLYEHPQVLIYNQEIHHLLDATRGPAKMVKSMYELGPYDANKRRGYKAPNDIRRPPALSAFRKYWPDTRLVVGLRHPVKWFESYYNFNVRQSQKRRNFTDGEAVMLPAEQMVGRKLPDRVQFHHHLAMLGKTNVTDPKEQALLNGAGSDMQSPNTRKAFAMPYPPAYMRNQVFLYEVSQPFVKENGLARRFAHDFKEFLQLDKPLRPVDNESTLRKIFLKLVGKKKKEERPNFHYAIDICDDKFVELRRELLQVGKEASQWISQFLLNQPSVHVSSPQHFRDLLSTWSIDPCETTTFAHRRAEEQAWECF